MKSLLSYLVFNGVILGTYLFAAFSTRTPAERFTFKSTNPLPILGKDSFVREDKSQTTATIEQDVEKLFSIKTIYKVIVMFAMCVLFLWLIKLSLEKGAINFWIGFYVIVVFSSVYRCLVFAADLLKLHLGKSFTWIKILVSLMAAISIVLFKNWLTIDIASLAICVSILVRYQRINLKPYLIFAVAIIVYDVFSVFYTKHMIDVVQKLIAVLPIMLIVPKSFSLSSSMVAALGLGDIVIPGIITMIAFRATLKYKTNLYYIAALLGYFVGLFFAELAVYFSGKGQPATLYLIPCCFFAFSITAIAKGKFTEIYSGSF